MRARGGRAAAGCSRRHGRWRRWHLLFVLFIVGNALAIIEAAALRSGAVHPCAAVVVLLLAIDVCAVVAVLLLLLHAAGAVVRKFMVIQQQLRRLSIMMRVIVVAVVPVASYTSGRYARCSGGVGGAAIGRLVCAARQHW